ncbi:YhcB family protein [Alloalcanivorax mobilis]|uniref:YhcB family protein n=1 Tax=Alloalcanivorax mobilis TaxID=2019569 RepID=UPI000C79213E|nr:YhcB family protein [Alloalcanivorax mobilis]|tara:strand:+ start:11394 stop:11915 length:522 start_codon:yes stop_codon:yes gene_type:complete
MDMLTTNVICFLAGLVVGAGLLYWFLPARRQSSAVMRERDDARNALNHYRDQVDHHFLHTAELVNDMTQAYRAVHQHLSQGAQALCSEGGRKRAAAKSLDSAYDEPEAPLSQPLDYAPKAQGTLSEDFGLRQKADGPFSPLEVDEEGPEIVIEPPRDYADAGDEENTDSKRRA